MKWHETSLYCISTVATWGFFNVFSSYQFHWKLYTICLLLIEMPGPMFEINQRRVLFVLSHNKNSYSLSIIHVYTLLAYWCSGEGAYLPPFTKWSLIQSMWHWATQSDLCYKLLAVICSLLKALHTIFIHCFCVSVMEQGYLFLWTVDT